MDEAAAMLRAIELAARGLGTTSPNPVVGCVLLTPDGTVVGEGWHRRAGGKHAEVVALDAAGTRARGGTAVVSLEPCGHVGRTPPCTDALIGAGVSRVVWAVADPDHGGSDRLRDAGIAVEGGLLAEAAARGNESWLISVRRGRPHVHLKFAATLDGRSAAPDGTSRWITGAAARRDVHRLRSQVDAIVVGIGTVLADDPELTARDDQGTPLFRQPLRVVVDPSGRTPRDARVRKAPGELWLATGRDLRTDPDGRIVPEALLAGLAERGLVSVLLEGGPRLAGSFLTAGLVDRVTAYVAPSLLGGGLPALLRPGVTTLSERIDLSVDDVTTIEGDIRISGLLRGRPAR